MLWTTQRAIHEASNAREHAAPLPRWPFTEGEKVIGTGDAPAGASFQRRDRMQSAYHDQRVPDGLERWNRYSTGRDVDERAVSMRMLQTVEVYGRIDPSAALDELSLRTGGLLRPGAGRYTPLTRPPGGAAKIRERFAVAVSAWETALSSRAEACRLDLLIHVARSQP